MSTATIAVEDQELKQEALSVVERATAIKIIDQATYDEASTFLLEIVKPMRTRWKEYWEGVRAPAYLAYQKILAKIKEGDLPLERAEDSLKKSIRDWDVAQENLRQERQREAQRKAEADEAAKRLQDSVFAEEAGAIEEAEAIMSAPSTAVAAPVEPTYQRASGISTRENWKARVTDIKALCRAIGAGKVPITYVEANMSVLNARAKADKNTMDVPGVQAFNDPIVAGRSR